MFFMEKLIRKNFPNRNIYNYKTIYIIAILFLCSGFLIIPTYNYPIIRYSILMVALIMIVAKRDYIVNCIGKLWKLKKGQ